MTSPSVCANPCANLISLSHKGRAPVDNNSVWIMAGFELAVMDPNVGTPDNVLGFSYKFGVTWGDNLLLFTAHSIKGPANSVYAEDHRFDHALLFGVANRTPSFFMTASAGLSLLDYAQGGQSGSVPGLAASANIYVTPVRGWGALGCGIYGSLSSGHSYIALEISVIELNIAIP